MYHSLADTQAHEGRAAKVMDWQTGHQRRMNNDRMPSDEYEDFARAIANRIKPGTIKGRRADNLPVGEEKHFYVCKACGQAVDMRDLGQVFHHEVPDHEPLLEN